MDHKKADKAAADEEGKMRAEKAPYKIRARLLRAKEGSLEPIGQFTGQLWPGCCGRKWKVIEKKGENSQKII